MKSWSSTLNPKVLDQTRVYSNVDLSLVDQRHSTKYHEISRTGLVLVRVTSYFVDPFRVFRPVMTLTVVARLTIFQLRDR
jgi:hypothetical protein